MLAQTEEVSIECEHTDSMDIDTPLSPPKDKTISRAGSPTGKSRNAMPTPVLTARAFVLHGIAYSGPWKQKIQEAEGHLGGKEGESSGSGGSYRVLEGGERHSVRWLSF